MEMNTALPSYLAVAGKDKKMKKSNKGSGKGAEGEFQRVVIVGNGLYKTLLTKLEAPQVIVLAKEEIPFSGLPDFIRRNKHYGADNALWIFTSGVYSITEVQTHRLCHSCNNPINTLTMENDMSREAMVEMVEDIVAMMRGLKDMIKPLLGTNCSVILCPPLPSAVIKDDMCGTHTDLHNLCDAWNVNCIAPNTLRHLTTLFNLFCEEWLKVACEMMEMQGLSSVPYREYWETQGNCVEAVVEADDIDKVYKNWYSKMNIVIQSSLKQSNIAVVAPTKKSDQVAEQFDNEDENVNMTSAVDPDSNLIPRYKHIIVVGTIRSVGRIKDFKLPSVSYSQMDVSFDEAGISNFLNLQNTWEGSAMWILMTDISQLIESPEISEKCDQQFCSQPLQAHNLVTPLPKGGGKISKLRDTTNSFMKTVMGILNKESNIILAPITPVRAVNSGRSLKLKHPDLHSISISNQDLPFFEGNNVFWTDHFTDLETTWLAMVQRLIQQQDLPTDMLDTYFMDKGPPLEIIDDSKKISEPFHAKLQWENFMEHLIKFIGSQKIPAPDEVEDNPSTSAATAHGGQMYIPPPLPKDPPTSANQNVVERGPVMFSSGSGPPGNKPVCYAQPHIRPPPPPPPPPPVPPQLAGQHPSPGQPPLPNRPPLPGPPGPPHQMMHTGPPPGPPPPFMSHPPPGFHQPPPPFGPRPPYGPRPQYGYRPPPPNRYTLRGPQLVPALTYQQAQQIPTKLSASDEMELADAKKKIFVSNLPKDLADDDIKNLLETCGTLISYERPNISGAPAGYCMAKFEDLISTCRAQRILENQDILGNMLVTRMPAAYNLTKEEMDFRDDDVDKEASKKITELLKTLNEGRSAEISSLQVYISNIPDGLNCVALRELLFACGPLDTYRRPDIKDSPSAYAMLKCKDRATANRIRRLLDKFDILDSRLHVWLPSTDVAEEEKERDETTDSIAQHKIKSLVAMFNLHPTTTRRFESELSKESVERLFSDKKDEERKSRSKSKSPIRKKSSSPRRNESRSLERQNSQSRERQKSQSNERQKSQSNERRKSGSRERKKSGSRERKKSRSCERIKSGSRDRLRSGSRDKRKSASRDKSGSSDRAKSGSRERRKSGSRERRKSGSRERRKSGSRERRRSGSRERRRSGSRERRRSGSRERRKSGSRERRRSGSRERRRSGSRERRRSGSRERRRSGSRERRRSGSRDRRRSGSRDKRRSGSRERRRSRSRDRRRNRSQERYRSPDRYRNRRSPFRRFNNPQWGYNNYNNYQGRGGRFHSFGRNRYQGYQQRYRSPPGRYRSPGRHRSPGRYRSPGRNRSPRRHSPGRYKSPVRNRSPDSSRHRSRSGSRSRYRKESRSPSRKRSLSTDRKLSKSPDRKRKSSPKRSLSREVERKSKSPESHKSEDIEECVRIKLVNQSGTITRLLAPVFQDCGALPTFKEEAGGAIFFFPRPGHAARTVVKYLDNFRLPDRLVNLTILDEDKIEEETMSTIVEEEGFFEKLDKILLKHEESFVNFSRKPLDKDIDLRTFKTIKCEDRYCTATCPNYHSDRDRRRDPVRHKYSENRCYEEQQGYTCPDGDHCNKAHSIVERMFHPALFRRELCMDWYENQTCSKRDKVCAFAHPESPEVLFNDAWKDLYVTGLGKTTEYLAGAIKNLHFLPKEKDGLHVILLTPSVKFAHWVARAVQNLAVTFEQSVTVVTDKHREIGFCSVLVTTPSGLSSLLRGGSGRTPLNLSFLGAIIIDDPTRLLGDHSEQFQSIAAAIEASGLNRKTDLNRVAVADTFVEEEIETLGDMFNTDFEIPGQGEKTTSKVRKTSRNKRSKSRSSSPQRSRSRSNSTKRSRSRSKSPKRKRSRSNSSKRRSSSNTPKRSRSRSNSPKRSRSSSSSPKRSRSKSISPKRSKSRSISRSPKQKRRVRSKSSSGSRSESEERSPVRSESPKRNKSPPLRNKSPHTKSPPPRNKSPRNKSPPLNRSHSSHKSPFRDASPQTLKKSPQHNKRGDEDKPSEKVANVKTDTSDNEQDMRSQAAIALPTWLSSRLHPAIVKELLQAVKDLRAQHDKEYTLFRTVPEIHPEYKKKHAAFIKKFKKVPQIMDNPELCQDIWKKVWVEDIRKIEEAEWKRKKDELVQFICRSQNITPPDESPSKNTPTKSEDKKTEKQKRKSDTDQSEEASTSSSAPQSSKKPKKEFSIVACLELFSELSTDLGILGHSLRAIIEQAQELGLNSDKCWRLFAEEDNIKLMHMAADKFKGIASKSDDDDRRIKFKQASKLARSLVDVASNYDSEGKGNDKGFDIHEVAQLTKGRDKSDIIKVIKAKLDLEGIKSPSKDQVKDILQAVKSIHTKMSD